MEVMQHSFDEHVIRVRAYEVWTAKGCPMGTALQDWLEAERLVKQAVEPSPLPPAVAALDPMLERVETPTVAPTTAKAAKGQSRARSAAPSKRRSRSAKN